MRFGSVCSGIEAATVAWQPLGWQTAFVSEIEPFPCAALAHHYPTVPNLGDMTKFQDWPDAAIDVLVGGTPCQSFSIAGLRKGLADPRGNLMLTYLAIASRFAPRWLVWENVPGVLSSNGGRDFGTFLGGLGALGYGFAYRVLDAQYFGVAQRRRRVFVVANFGDWRRAAAVLSERESLLGNPAPRRESGQSIAPTLSARTKGSGGLGTDFECDGGLITQAIAFNARQDPDSWIERCGPIDTDGTTQAISVNLRGREGGNTAELSGDVATALRASQGGSDKPHVLTGSTVRRLTPLECERLQGFPDNYTNIPFRGKPAADDPRYKSLGNSMAVPVMRWIGRRIAEVEAFA